MPRLPAPILMGLVLITALITAGLSAAPDPDLATQTRQLLSRYRQTTRDPAAQDAVVQDLLKLGEDARNQLQTRVQQDWSKDLKIYSSKFLAAAGSLSGKMRKMPAAREIPALQAQVTDLVKIAALSKDQIKEQADPALKKLEQILQPELQAVFDSSRTLKENRDKLVTDGRHLRTLAEQNPETLVEAEETRLLVQALASSRQDLGALEDNDQNFSAMDAEELSGIRELNRRRLLLGLRALKIDPKLCDAARDHSKDMKKLGFFDHDSPVPGKRSPWDRARNFGTSASAENIASGSKTGVGATDQWWYSPGHFKNMMGDHLRIGLGRDDTLWTQMFGQ